MAAQTIKLAGKNFVILPEAEYRKLRNSKSRPKTVAQLNREQDRRDAEKVEKALAAYHTGTLKTISHEQLKKSLGL